MIRSIGAGDLLAVRTLVGRHGATELTAPNWPKTPPENRTPTPWWLIQGALIPRRGKARVGIAIEHDRSHGLVVAQPRGSELVWDVEHLIVPASLDAGVELLHWACDQASSHLARRIFLETSEEGPGFDVANRAGFERCTGGTMFVLPAGATVDKTDSVPARPRLRSDEMGLFQLYNAVVPAPVRSAEALDYQEWGSLHRGRKPWGPSLVGAQDYVWEMGPRVVGWVHLIYGERAQHMNLLIHPQADALAERMVRDAIAQLSPKVPVLVDTREYQESLKEALHNLGFGTGHGYLVWVKQFARRVTEPSLATVQAQPTALA